MPLLLLPMVLNILAETLVALGRISKFLLAEDLPEPSPIDWTSTDALRVDGTFTWEVGGAKPEEHTKGKKKLDKAAKKAAKRESKRKTLNEKDLVLPTVTPTGASTPEPEVEDVPFSLDDLHMKVPRGSFVAIVGPVGSGKSSILQAIIGEMRKTEGSVTVGANIAYVPQSAWIRNATLRENVLFGAADNEERYVPFDLRRNVAKLELQIPRSRQGLLLATRPGLATTARAD